MTDTITLADPTTSCNSAANSARRVESLALLLSVALESPRQSEAQSGISDLLSMICVEASRMREHAEDAAESIRQAEG